jgi:hypothetical protein
MGYMYSGLTHPKPETGFLREYLFTKPTIFRRNPVSLRKSWYFFGNEDESGCIYLLASADIVIIDYGVLIIAVSEM